MWWDRFVRVLRIVAAIWVGAIAIIAALQHLQLMPDLPKLEPFAWVFSLVIIGIDSTGALVANKVRRDRVAQKAKIERALMGLLLNLSQRQVLRFEELSASVFVPSRWSRFWRWVLRRSDDHLVLSRLVQFRPVGFPPQSGIKYTPTKGAVGECWRTRRHVVKDFEALAERWGSVELTDEAFQQIKITTRQGFTLAEFKTVAPKYSEIAAEPIWHPTKEAKLIGVLTLDRPRRPSAAAFTARLNARETPEQMTGVALVIGGIIHPRSEQL